MAKPKKFIVTIHEVREHRIEITERTAKRAQAVANQLWSDKKTTFFTPGSQGWSTTVKPKPEDQP